MIWTKWVGRCSTLLISKILHKSDRVRIKAGMLWVWLVPHDKLFIEMQPTVKCVTGSTWRCQVSAI